MRSDKMTLTNEMPNNNIVLSHNQFFENTTEENAGGINTEIDQLLTAITIAKDDHKGIGKFFAKTFKDQMRYDRSCKQWYMFDGHVWIPDICRNYFHALDGLQAVFEEQAKKLAINLKKEQHDTGYGGPYSEALIKAGYNPEMPLKLLRERSKQLSDYSYRNTCFKYAESGGEDAGGLSINGDEWNKDPYLLGCKNGVINLKTGEFSAGRPEDFITFQTAVNYNPDALCPHFEKFVREITGNDEDVYNFVRRLFGLSLIGDANIKQYCVFMNGRGRNGKGTLMQTIDRVLGGNYAGKIDPSLLITSKYDAKAAGAEIYALKDKRLVYTEESAEGDKINVPMLKLVTGGGYLEARIPYDRSYTKFKATHLTFFETNRMPVLDPSDIGLIHRIIKIDFPFTYVDNPKNATEKKINLQMPDILEKESEGILKWLIRGCIECQEDIKNTGNIVVPDSIKQLNKDYVDENNNVPDFIEKYCNTGEALRIPQAELYRYYETCMYEEGEIPLGKNIFYRAVDNIGEDRGFRRNRRVYRGIGKK